MRAPSPSPAEAKAAAEAAAAADAAAAAQARVAKRERFVTDLSQLKSRRDQLNAAKDAAIDKTDFAAAKKAKDQMGLCDKEITRIGIEIERM